MNMFIHIIIQPTEVDTNVGEETGEHKASHLSAVIY